MEKVVANKVLIKPIVILCLFTFLSETSISQINDSVTIYKKIKKVADKSKFATLIYNAIFVDPRPQEYPKEPSSKEEKIVNPYLQFENKVIRKINIKVYDPFGFSVSDTLLYKTNTVQKFGNSLHVSSFKRVITSRLLFRENQPLDPLSLSESERLIRQSTFVNDARIIASETTGKDSVDVFVIVQDKWTVVIPVVVTDAYANARFRNHSLLGTGNQFEQFVEVTKTNEVSFSGFYNISNIRHTYLSSRLYYETNKNGTVAGVSLESPFYSPLAEWAGGANLSGSWKYFTYTDSVTGVIKKTDLNSSSYDVWLGKNIRINTKRKLLKQSANFIIGERFYINNYDKRPSFAIDAEKKNVNSSAIIGNFGFAVHQYYKDRFIYRFGANEDVPYGLIIQMIYGVTDNEFGKSKYYIGGEIVRARHYKVGYFSSLFAYGMFFGKTSANDITTRVKFNYFSDLFRIGKWYLREFVNNNWVYGLNKIPGQNVSITSDDLYGLNGDALSGNSKVVLNIETVAYAPYNVLGFRFAPTLLLGYGMVGSQKHNFSKSNLYQAYAIALMVRNENLLSSTFEISFGYYPLLPNGENNAYKYSPVTNFTLKVNGFTIGKPAFISY